MNMLNTIQDIVLTYPEREVRFTETLEVKLPFGSFICHALHIEKEGLYLMDGQGEWHGPLKEDQINAKQVILSLYKRLMRIRLKAA